MSETKWTPGPWHVAGHHNDCQEFWVGSDVYTFTEKEWEANRRLIAAAPEMAEVLHELVQWGHGMSFRDKQHPTWRKAEALLAHIDRKA